MILAEVIYQMLQAEAKRGRFCGHNCEVTSPQQQNPRNLAKKPLGSFHREIDDESRRAAAVQSHYVSDAQRRFSCVLKFFATSDEHEAAAIEASATKRI